MADNDVLKKAMSLFEKGKRKEAARFLLKNGYSGMEIERFFERWTFTGAGDKEKTMGDLAAEVLKDYDKEDKIIYGKDPRALAKRKDRSLVPYGGGGGEPPKETKLLTERDYSKNLPALRGPRDVAVVPGKKKSKVFLGTRTKVHLSRPKTRRGEIVWSLVMIIAGMTGAALLQSMWIFFSFLCLGLYILVPGPDEMIGGELRKIKEKYIKRIEGASSDAERESIEKDLEETLKNQRTIETIKAGQGFIKWGASSMKYLFKAGFFVLFSLGFITSAIPLMKPLGIFIAFIGYFMEG